MHFLDRSLEAFPDRREPEPEIAKRLHKAEFDEIAKAEFEQPVVVRIIRQPKGFRMARLAAEQKRGTLRADLDPKLIALTIMSMLAFPFVAAPVAREALALTPDPGMVERLIAHHLAVLERGVVAPEPSTSRTGGGAP